jgi:extracellular elastinolytic metalloproteinase
MARTTTTRGELRRLLLATAAVAAFAAAGTAQAAQPGAGDYERANRSVAPVPASVAAARRVQRQKLGRFGVLQVAPRSGGVRAYGRLDGLLTEASTRPATDIALDFVHARPQIFGLDAADLSRLQLVRHYSAGGIEQLRWAQSYAGITAIDTSLTANLTAAGQLVNVVGEPRHDLALASVTPGIGASEAYAGAARSLAGRPASVERAAGGPDRATAFTGGGTAKLVIYEGGGPRLGWRLTIPVDSAHVYDAVVDASTGVLQRAHNLVESVTATISRNYPGAPVGGTRTSVDIDAFLAPGARRLIGPAAHTFTDADDVVQASGDPPPAAGEVTPVGGNFDFAITDPFDPDCSPLLCIWNPLAPSSWVPNRAADATQLHWFVSNYHEYLATTPAIGFTSAAGNFEGADRLIAQSMDGANTAGGLPDIAHVNNANMTTLPDGTSPLMQMYLTNVGGHRTSTGLDPSVVYHEYTHGLVGRTIVDAAGAQAVSGAQSGAFNEGTADFYAMDYLVSQGLETDAPAVADVTLAKFAFGGAGLRTEPVDCGVVADPAVCGGGGTLHPGGYTYADFAQVAGFPEVHADGEIWAQAMWQLRQVLVARLGDATGVDHVRRLLTNAMRLVPDNPSYLDLRNGLLQAAAASDPADAGDVWSVFAERGMGYFASTTGTGDLRPFADTSPLPPAGAPTGTVTGVVTDAATGQPVAGLKVAFTGHDTGIGPDLSATTSASGSYTISGVPTGTYPLLRVRGGGYAGDSANVAVAQAPATTTRSCVVARDVASIDAGARIVSADGPDFTAFGCGPTRLIDLDPGVVWSTTTAADPDAPGPKAIVVELPSATDLTQIDIDPTPGCGDDDNAALGEYEVQASTDGTSFTSISTGTFTPADLRRSNPITLTATPTGTRFIKLIAKTSQSDTGSGTVFIDVAELRAFGTPTPPPPPPPPPADPAPAATDTAPAPDLPPPLSPFGGASSADRTGPRVRLAGATLQRLGAGVRIAVTCVDTACVTRTTATVRVPRIGRRAARTYRLAAPHASLTRGARRILVLKVAGSTHTALARALRAHRRLTVAVTVTAKDAAGNATTVRRSVRLKRR